MSEALVAAAYHHTKNDKKHRPLLSCGESSNPRLLPDQVRDAFLVQSYTYLDNTR
jgi:hypothetical protein